jgi:protein O-mannosyl-transferase
MPWSANLSNNPSSQIASFAHSKLRVAGGILLLAVATVTVYSPALQGDFIMDDDLLLTQNKVIHAPDGLFKVWTTQSIDFWPLTNTSLWLEWRLWDAHSTGYHITNLMLHIANSLLLWLLLRRLRIPGAFLAALLFALHPVNVASVAWIAQRKNVLALLFFLLSILGWLKWDEQRAAHRSSEIKEAASDSEGSFGPGWWYAASLLAFVLAMLSKGSVAILPVMMLLLTWWRRGVITHSDFLLTVPFWLVTAVLVPVNIWFQTHGAEEAILNVSLAQRFVHAGASVWFYLWKALWPLNLLFLYPSWKIDVYEFWWWLPLLAAIGTTFVLFWQRHIAWVRSLFVAWLFFCVALLPVLGFTDLGLLKYTPVADHYEYLAIISVVALVAATMSWLSQLWKQPLRVALAAVLIVALGYLTWQQCALYAGPITLYTATLASNPECWILRYNLGTIDQQAGRADQAIENFAQTLQLNPNYAEAHNNLGAMLALKGDVSAAIAHYERAIQLKPKYALAHDNLGKALVGLGKPQEAIDHFQQALQVVQDDAEIHYDLGVAFSNLGQPQDALAQYQAALRLKPDYAEACANEAVALSQVQRSSEALEAAQQALKLAQSSGNADLARSIESWLNSYRASLPNR